nr:FRG domain-containing protein [Corynebacterium sp. 76QC2CO]
MLLVEKFFSERELSVTDRNGVDDVSARGWFDAVKEAVGNLPTYRHESMGLPESVNPNSIPSDGNPGVWLFRGQKDASFAFTSTLYRRLLDAVNDGFQVSTPKGYEQAMVEAERDLLKQSKAIGIGRGLTALETLTLLQHHGSPTRLIDVTSDWKVALYFACESDDSSDGRIFLVKIDPKRWLQFPKAKSENQQSLEPIWQDYKKAFPEGGGTDERYSWLSGTWPILLPFSDPRMISQQGFFLVGGVPSLKGKALLYTSKCSDCSEKMCSCGAEKYGNIGSALDTQEVRQITSLAIRFGAEKKRLSDLSNVKFNNWTAIGYSIRVPHELKRGLRDILRNDEGIHADSLYPPLRETVRLFEHVVTEAFNK